MRRYLGRPSHHVRSRGWQLHLFRGEITTMTHFKRTFIGNISLYSICISIDRGYPPGYDRLLLRLKKTRHCSETKNTCAVSNTDVQSKCASNGSFGRATSLTSLVITWFEWVIIFHDISTSSNFLETITCSPETQFFCQKTVNVTVFDTRELFSALRCYFFEHVVTNYKSTYLESLGKYTSPIR